VHFIGEISPQRVGEFLASLDVFVFPSRAETFGLAAVEAASSGIPTVVRDLPVLQEVLSVEGKPAALFVDASDNEKLSAAVSRILNDKNLRDDLRRIGKGLASRYTVDAMVGEYARVLDETIPAAGGQP
jgi:glycosyltransferase involved in cell wall biosynthesis